MEILFWIDWPCVNQKDPGDALVRAWSSLVCVSSGVLMGARTERKRGTRAGAACNKHALVTHLARYSYGTPTVLPRGSHGAPTGLPRGSHVTRTHAWLTHVTKTRASRARSSGHGGAACDRRRVLRHPLLRQRGVQAARLVPGTPTPSYAPPTPLSYALKCAAPLSPTRAPATSHAPLLCPGTHAPLAPMHCSALCLRACYAVPGTDVGYGATRWSF
eukprot:1240447-Rhodomonas_salina.3